MRAGCFHACLAFSCFYCPPAVPSQSVHDVCDNVESMMMIRANQHILACGDFTMDMSDRNKPLLQTFHYFITSHSLTQSISSPTRYGNSSATILELFLATPDIPIFNFWFFSTLFMITYTFAFSSSVLSPVVNLHLSLTVFSFKNFSPVLKMTFLVLLGPSWMFWMSTPMIT